MSRYSRRLDEALIFAASMHAGQRRKTTPIPYIVHPVSVAWLLVAYGCEEDTVIAGLLHDVLEDTAATIEDLVGRFGNAVAQIVVACSEADTSLPWEQRKAAAVAAMRRMGPAARAVACADKAHNLHTMADALERGEDVWPRFLRGPDKQLDYHRQALAALSNGWAHAILGELRVALQRVERLVSSSG